MLTVNELKEFFKIQNSHPKKELGQNFLVDKQTINIICDSLNLNKDDKLLEIGGGLGQLSENLIGKTNDYTIVEYDPKFIEYLSDILDTNKVKIIRGDILKYKNCYQNKIVGNLPYYITTETIEYLIKQFDNLDYSVLMIQEEAYQRIIKKSGKEYGPLNIVLDYLFENKLIKRVNKNCFFPVPAVDSIAFCLKKKQEKNIDFARNLLKITKILFLNRRKTIYNNLNNYLKNSDKSERILNELNIPLSKRPEEISTDKFVSLVEKIRYKKIIVSRK